MPELRAYSWHLIAFDEAHKLKNSESVTVKLARKLKSKRRLLLTGTPLQNNVMELWSLLNFMMPDIFSDSEEFENWFNFDQAKGAATEASQMSEQTKIIVV